MNISAPPAESKRIAALDATKGVLVVFMVLYHCLNYSSEFHLAFRYFSFLPPSFIIITGFLLSNVYLARYAPTDRGLHARLLTRGLKLLLLFGLLNVAAQFVHSRHYHNPTAGIGNFFAHWEDVFVYGDNRMVVFEILLPIAYLLLMAPLLLLLSHAHQFALPVSAALLLAASAAAEQYSGAMPNFSLVVAGIVGMWIGRISRNTLADLGRFVGAAVVLYVVIAVIRRFWVPSHLLQIAEALFALAAIYGVSTRIMGATGPKRILVRLGEYSLFAYIIQIAILQLTSHFAGRPHPFSARFVFLVGSTLILTSVFVEVVAWSRRRLPFVNGAYRTVFA